MLRKPFCDAQLGLKDGAATSGKRDDLHSNGLERVKVVPEADDAKGT